MVWETVARRLQRSYGRSLDVDHGTSPLRRAHALSLCSSGHRTPGPHTARPWGSELMTSSQRWLFHEVPQLTALHTVRGGNFCRLLSGPNTPASGNNMYCNGGKSSDIQREANEHSIIGQRPVVERETWTLATLEQTPGEELHMH